MLLKFIRIVTSFNSLKRLFLNESKHSSLNNYNQVNNNYYSSNSINICCIN